MPEWIANAEVWKRMGFPTLIMGLDGPLHQLVQLSGKCMSVSIRVRTSMAH
jgi:hypothetical protein